jgi:hypothetical protein
MDRSFFSGIDFVIDRVNQFGFEETSRKGVALVNKKVRLFSRIDRDNIALAACQA